MAKTYQKLTDASVEPVTLDEAKDHARVDVADDDTLITALITAARLRFEQQTGVYLLSQTHQLTLDTWPMSQADEPWWDGVRDGHVASLFGSGSAAVVIERRPVLTLTSVKTITESGTETVISDTTYYTTPHTEGLQVVPNTGWPIPGRTVGGIILDFTLGYGTVASNVPQDIKQAILMMVAHWLENREAVDVVGTIARGVSVLPVPMGAASIMRGYALLEVA